MIVLSLLDKILRLFGTSEQRVKWKMHIRRQQKEKDALERKNTAKHLTYKHKLCDGCGQPIDRKDKKCPHCDRRVASWGVKLGGKVADRLLPGQGSMTTALLVSNGALFLLAVLATGSIWSMDLAAAMKYGASFGPFNTGGGEWWRFVTANFAHVGGAMHIGFNLYALAIVGPIVEQWYGSSRATVIYVLTGIASMIISHLVSPGFSGGASGAVMGLIGAGVAAGHTSATRSGMAMRNGLMRWFLFVVLFGLIVPRIDNAAHIGGFVAGIGLGVGLGASKRLKTREMWVFRGLAGVCVALCVVSIGLMFWTNHSRPAVVENRDVRIAWRHCEEAVRGEDPEAAEICDDFAYKHSFYGWQADVRLVATLYRQQGNHAASDRLLSIWEASISAPAPPGLFSIDQLLPRVQEGVNQL